MWDIAYRIREILGIVVGALLFLVAFPVLLAVLMVGCAGLAVMLGAALVCVPPVIGLIVAMLLMFQDKTIKDIQKFAIRKQTVTEN